MKGIAHTMDPQTISATQLSGVFETIIILLAIAAFCFCAGYYIRDIADWIRHRESKRKGD